MKRILLSTVIAGCILGASVPTAAYAQNMPTAGGVGLTGWTGWKRENVSATLRFCTRNYYRKGNFVKQQTKFVPLWSTCQKG